MVLALSMSSNVGYYFHEFHEDILNSFKVIWVDTFSSQKLLLTNFEGAQLKKIYIQELWFLRSAHRPMLVNIYLKLSWTVFKWQSGHDFVTQKTWQNQYVSYLWSGET